MLIGFVFCLAATLVGQLQPVGEVARAELPREGRVEVSIEPARLVDLSAHQAADLALAFEIRVTRHDDVTGPSAVSYVRNGRLQLFDRTGTRLLELNSPLQKGVAGTERPAGEWLAAEYSLADLQPGAGLLSKVVLYDHNDIPKVEQAPTGITYEIRNLRLLNVAADRARAAELATKTVAIENRTPLTTINPLDLNYRIEPVRRRDNGTFTEPFIGSGDPAIVVFKGKYWLFASHGEGYWRSTDLAAWHYVRIPADHPFADQFGKWAPGTCVIGETLFLTHSENGDVLKTTDPADVTKWERVGHPAGWADPAFLYDDPAEGGDGFVYAYSGLSHRNPISVLRLDPKQDFKVVGGPWETAWPDMLNRGYEVPGDDNTHYHDNDTQEGPWVVKHDGRYYLTCAVPGTGFATYCDNCYVAPTPIGPFVFAPNSPVSRKATGFTQGAGHGGVFKDMRGHWWKIDLCRVRGIARRLVLLPAEFGEDGRLYTNSYLSDYPFYVPGRSAEPFNEPSPGWMLLSYGKRATASSNAGGAGMAFDEKCMTAWVPETDKPGEWISVDLGRLAAVRSVQVSFEDTGYQAGGREAERPYRYLVEFSQNGRDWKPLLDRTQATAYRPHEYVEFQDVVGARYVRLTNKSAEIAGGGRFALSGLRLFGEGGGEKPAEVAAEGVFAERRAFDNRSVGISWPAAEGVEGYIVRYGLSPDKLYQHYQVMGKQSCRINALNRGHDYFFTVDAYNMNGVTAGTWTRVLKATEPLDEGYDPGENNTALKARLKGVKVHEAEAAELTGEGLHVEYEVRASGVKAVHGFGSVGTGATFWAERAGTGIRFAYAAIEDAHVEVTVGGRTERVTLKKTKGWSSFATVDVAVEVKEGEKIEVKATGERFHLDWLQIEGEFPRRLDAWR